MKNPAGAGLSIFPRLQNDVADVRKHGCFVAVGQRGSGLELYRVRDHLAQILWYQWVKPLSSQKSRQSITVGTAGVPQKDALGRGAGFHSFRRFVGTELARQRVNPKVIQARLGHKDITTTLKSYVDEHSAEDFDSATALSEAVYGRATGKSEKILASGADVVDTHGAESPMSTHKSQHSTLDACPHGRTQHSLKGERLGSSAAILPILSRQGRLSQ